MSIMCCWWISISCCEKRTASSTRRRRVIMPRLTARLASLWAALTIVARVHGAEPTILGVRVLDPDDGDRVVSNGDRIVILFGPTLQEVAHSSAQ